MPIVSIIIPTYNRRALLEKAVLSILAQTYRDFELIVVDDNSKDDTQHYLKTVTDPRVRLIFSSRVGVAEARNKGVAAASGKWLAFCDCDDLWAPGKLQKQMDRLTQDKGLALLFSDARIIRNKLPQPETIFSVQKPHNGDIFIPLLLDNFIPTSTVMVSRAVFGKTPGFEGVFSPAEDYRLWLRLARQGPCEYIDEPLAFYRIHGNQMGSDLTRMYPACADVITTVLAEAGISVADVPGLDIRLWQLHFLAGRKFAEKSMTGHARQQYGLAARYRPLSKATAFKWLSYIGI